MRKNIFKILILSIVSIIVIIFSVIFVKIKEQSKNDTIKIVYVNDIDWQSEGGILSGTFVGDKLLSIDISSFRSMFQTNEKYYIFSDVIFYEKSTYLYDEPMDVSSVSIEEESYIILNNEVYLKKYDEQEGKDVLIKDTQDTDIITKFIEFKKIIEEKYSS